MENKKTYIGIQSEKGLKIEKENAFDYALSRIMNNKNDMAAFEKEFGKEIVDWFYSGNWIEEENNG